VARSSALSAIEVLRIAHRMVHIGIKSSELQSMFLKLFSHLFPFDIVELEQAGKNNRGYAASCARGRELIPTSFTMIAEYACGNADHLRVDASRISQYAGRSRSN
jgi:hypothetical protein